MRYPCGQENPACGGEGKGLPADIELDFTTQVLRVVGVSADVQDNLIEIMHMLVDMGIGVGYVVNPAEFDIVVDSRHLSTAHISHSGALAVFDSRAGLIDWFPDKISFIVHCSHCLLFSFLNVYVIIWILRIEVLCAFTRDILNNSNLQVLSAVITRVRCRHVTWLLDMSSIVER
jgi:hypothetical protein